MRKQLLDQLIADNWYALMKALRLKLSWAAIVEADVEGRDLYCFQPCTFAVAVDTYQPVLLNTWHCNLLDSAHTLRCAS
jgi:hypothetical protein